MNSSTLSCSQADRDDPRSRLKGASSLPAPAAPDASDLPATIERARALLDEGDVVAAKTLAADARSSAQRAERLAIKKGASDRLIDKVRRLQGEALSIEAMAMIALANEVDAAQAAGVFSKNGRPKKDGSCTGIGLKDTGISHNELFEARRVRDFSRVAPTAIEEFIQTRLAKGFAPTKADIRRVISGASRKSPGAVEWFHSARLIGRRDVASMRVGELEALELALIEDAQAVRRLREAVQVQDTLSPLRNVLPVKRIGELFRGVAK